MDIYARMNHTVRLVLIFRLSTKGAPLEAFDQPVHLRSLI